MKLMDVVAGSIDKETYIAHFNINFKSWGSGRTTEDSGV